MGSFSSSQFFVDLVCVLYDCLIGKLTSGVCRHPKSCESHGRALGMVVGTFSQSLGMQPWPSECNMSLENAGKGGTWSTLLLRERLSIAEQLSQVSL